ncbi:hypothetical protein E2553_00330 [Paraburkholderia dipogonis]|uniref:Uncharacterized protein n=1 Tax=Paraburkholderia dipogonis TaxID=1211383 RepID=A0A4Y8N1D0_9BURK|nr:hypothetical protein [Paraburkholderia dipogonis]TFE43617.1 hypothetical protein E2553_00330 [Paraburkholderia dipogonis]
MATKKGSAAPMTISSDEKRWRAQSDADTLARAQEIMQDRSRHIAAKSHAAKEAKRYSSVAGTERKVAAKTPTRGRK